MKRALSLALVIAVAGCVSLEKEYPDTRYFVLEAERVGAPAGRKSAERLKIRGFRISPRYGGREMVTRVDERRYEADFYNQFFADPATLVTEESYQWLGEAGLFAAVIDSAAPIDARYILDGVVVRLHGDERAAPEAVIEMQFFLLELDETGAPRILFNKSYDARESRPDGEAAGLVDAWSKGLGQILGALEKDLAALDLKP